MSRDRSEGPSERQTGDEPRVLVVTSRDDLLDDLLRLAAAAAVEVDVATDATAARRCWSAAAGVLVGDDLSEALLSRPPQRREGVVLVGVDEDDAGVWRRGVDLGAGHVVFLPDGEAWVAGWLADHGDVLGRRTASGHGTVVGVVGGRGGAGASTLTVALGLAAARAGAAAMLIDADPVGGGLDLLLGLEDTEGLRWSDLAGSRGRVSTSSLAAATLGSDGLRVLPWARDDSLELAPEAVSAVLAAAGRAHDLVLVDLPRVLDLAAQEAAARCDLVYLLVPTEIRAVAAAARVAVAVSLLVPRVEVVTRGPAPGGLDPEDVADALGLPLAGSMRAEPGLAVTLERGEPPGARGRTPLGRLCDRLVGSLLRRPGEGRVA